MKNKLKPRFCQDSRGMMMLLILMATFTTCKTADFAGDSKKSPPAPAVPPLQTLTFQQITRAGRQATFKQGTTGATSNEDYNVTASGVLDLLIVVDDSSSMTEEQQNLANRMAPLLSAVQDSDWRIAVTTTDPAETCVTQLIKKSDSNAANRFSKAINAGTNGTGIERPILRAVDGLKSECWWGPGQWLRDGSTVGVLIITDEDNCHIDIEHGYDCDGKDDKVGSYLTDYLATIRKPGVDARVYGIIRHPSQTADQCPTAMKSADIIADVIAKTNGTWGSICDSDYSATLSKISSDVAKLLKTDFMLKGAPDPGTLVINVNGQPWTQYTLTGLVVHFTSPPPVGAPIRVSYRSGAAGIVTNQFDMTDVPLDGSISAQVGGAIVSGVTYDTTTRKIIFPSNPPDGSNIVVSYKENRPLVDTFLIAQNADVKTVKVTVAGQVLPASGYTYDSATGAVKLKTPPAEGQQIIVEWRGSKKTG